MRYFLLLRNAEDGRVHGGTEIVDDVWGNKTKIRTAIYNAFRQMQYMEKPPLSIVPCHTESGEMDSYAIPQKNASELIGEKRLTYSTPITTTPAAEQKQRQRRWW